MRGRMLKGYLAALALAALLALALRLRGPGDAAAPGEAIPAESGAAAAAVRPEVPPGSVPPRVSETPVPGSHASHGDG